MVATTIPLPIEVFTVKKMHGKPYLPARASEQGNVIGSVHIYIIYICVYKKKL